ncbi:hypothetical protein [Delftia sp. HK171]|uniref:hypothetical protein n=1 Tax=Delftia sp. HK171 TaxID=1920191 RepID=UPI001152BC4D|nr:hypothetical protein [Delftia sp. HK171]
MLTYTYRFFTATLKFSWKIFIIIGGLVLSSIGNALTSFISDSQDDFGNETEPEHQKPIVVDKNSAMQAFYSGQCSSAEVDKYWNFEDKR